MQPDANAPRHTIRTEGEATQTLIQARVFMEIRNAKSFTPRQCLPLRRVAWRAIGGTLPCALMGCVLIVVSPGCHKWPVFERCTDCCFYHSCACDLRTSGMSA